jgi:two-component sensor histidine kinase
MYPYIDIAKNIQNAIFYFSLRWSKVILLLLFPFFIFAQTYHLDTLSSWLESKKHKNLSFNELLLIQKENGHQNSKVVFAYAKELLAKNELKNSPLKRAVAFAEIGLNYSNAGESLKADSLLQIAAEIFKLNDKTALLSDTYNRLAVHYTNIDADSVAVGYYTKAMKLAQEIKDTSLMLKPLRGLSGLFLKMGLYDKCIEYASSGLKLARFVNEKKSIAALANNMAAGYTKKLDYKKGIFYFKEALAINKKIGLQESIIRNASNLGTVYNYANNMDSASFYLHMAEVLLKEIDVPRTSIYTLAALGELKNKEKKYTHAIAYANQVISIGKKAGLESLTDGAYEVLSIAYKGLGQYDKALEAYENYWKIKQKFLETSRNKSIAQVEQQFQQYKKTKEIEIKTAEIGLLQKEKSISNLIRNGALVLVILLGLLAYLFYTRFKLKKKSSDALAVKNTEIEAQKEIIQSSLSEKETLLREIHHRVKNNLQIISSLLNIQSSHISDEKVLASIHEGQSRVQAMSLIHQNLYQSDHLSNVAMESYLEQLVSYLSGIFHTEQQSIKIQVKAKEIKFDIDTAIPLGLIVNELVSNALKYAFEKTQNEAQINIHIIPISEIDFELKVSDNGKGLEDVAKLENNTSMGLKLVKILSRQLRGNFRYERERGSVFVVNFKDLRLYNLSKT